jgi:hypothetical protein
MSALCQKRTFDLLSRQPSGDKSHIQLLQRWRVPSGVRLVLFCVQTALPLGVAAYNYDQVTGDSGAGATLGDFEGRVTAVGPVATYSFTLGKLPVTTQWTTQTWKKFSSVRDR